MLGTLERTEEHRLFLQWLEGVIVEHEVDALVIAGDLFDSATPPQSAVRLYFDFLASLHQRRRECRVVVTAGNHDSPAHLESPRDFLQLHGVHISATLPELARDLLIPLPSQEAPQLIVAALPFLRERDLRKGHLGQSPEEIERELRDGIAARYREAAEACTLLLKELGHSEALPLLATGHLTALGGVVSESEREIHVGGLGRVGADAFPADFAYVALGHLHRPQAVGGRDHIRYSGSPLTLSFSESRDRKEVRLLDFAEGALVRQEALAVPVARPLLSIALSRENWRKELASFEPPAAVRTPGGEALLPWVEITITDPRAGEDLVADIREASEGRGFEIIRVVARSSSLPAALALEGDEAAAGLASPKEVFGKRLEGEPLDETERHALLAAFDELHALYEERQRERA